MLFRALMLGSALMATVVAADKSPLANAPTSFVRAQASSGVRWHDWNEAVLTQARQQTKSVYVFIGSPLSELTRATINQTFTSEKTVAWLNENFFCIFVDADVQPDVAALGQHFINSVKQLRGSPVHLWLIPDTLQPYDGANYLPPSEEWGKPGFLKAARSALDAWTVEPARARALVTEALDLMKPLPLGNGAMPNLNTKLDTAAAAWVASLDAMHGGFGSAPKLPEPELIRFLLTRDKPAQDAALNAARALVTGALRDPVDGGFYRRCIDEAWKEPYFQKTLVDQARIALALFDAADLAKDEKLRAAGVAALDFALKDLRNSDGSFASALDGTLEENPDPAKRPKFTKTGQATTGAQGLLVAALVRSGGRHHVSAAKGMAENLRLGILPHVIGHQATGTAADHLAVALAFRALQEKAMADHMIAKAGGHYFELPSGIYMAAPEKLPPGLAARVPTSGDTPSAEVLALLAGVDEKTASLIRGALLNQIEYDELPPGDILLGLSQK